MENIVNNFLHKIEGELYLINNNLPNNVISNIGNWLRQYIEVLQYEKGVIFERTSAMLLIKIHNFIKTELYLNMSDSYFNPIKITKLFETLLMTYNNFFNLIKKECILFNLNNIYYLNYKQDFDYIKYYELFFVYVN
jgi:hypothetical protein